LTHPAGRQERERAEAPTRRRRARGSFEWPGLVRKMRASSPTERAFTVEYLGNVVGGGEVKHVNLDVADLERIDFVAA